MAFRGGVWSPACLAGQWNVPPGWPATWRQHAVSASFLGWTLDAFDFFVAIFLVETLAAQFHVSTTRIIDTTWATLAMRPVGAVIFGFLADRYGRRTPLMANVVFFSVVELLCGFAPNYTVFLVLRTIYGIGMGGEWGVGSSLAMESVPPKWRGTISGIVQSGYSTGYLLAALAAKIVLPLWGWRAMFALGGSPALLVAWIRHGVREPQRWQDNLERAGAAARKPLAMLFSRQLRRRTASPILPVPSTTLEDA